MRQFAVIFLALIGLISCSTLEEYANKGKDALSKAVGSKSMSADDAELRLIVGRKDLDELKQKVAAGANLEGKTFLLERAIPKIEYQGEKECPNDIIEYLISQGVRPTEKTIETSCTSYNSCEYSGEHLSRPMKLGCIKTVKMITPRLDSTELELALENFLKNDRFESQLDFYATNCASYATGETIHQAEAFLLVLRKLIKDCPDCKMTKKANLLNEKLSKAEQKNRDCIAQEAESAKYNERRIKRGEEIDQYLESPLGKICSTLQSMSSIKAVIRREEAVGARSGYVNKNTIYQGNKALIVLEEQLVQQKTDYQKHYKRSFNSTECKNHEAKSTNDL